MPPCASSGVSWTPVYRGGVTPERAEPDTQDSAEDEARRRYINALIARGEAARAVDGELPDGATHEIVEDEKGNMTVVRRRFSIG